MDFIDLKAQYSQIQPKIQARIQSVLEHGHYILGPEVSELEQRLSDFTGAKFTITCANGTDALSLALMALDIKPGDEVVTTAFSFFATAEAICLAGATPVFIDIDPETYNLDASNLEHAITDKTKAILVVSLFGQCPDMDTINAIASKNELPVIEDAAQSFGALYKGRRSCNLTTIACTSFFPAKPLGCYGDGGACFTNDEVLAKKIKSLRVHGKGLDNYDNVRIGMNSRLDTIQAAVLLEKLVLFPKEIEARNRIASTYSSALKDKFDVPFISGENTSVWAQYCLRSEDREATLASLKEHGIPSAIYYGKALPEQTALSGIKKHASYDVASRVSKEIFSIPMHPYLSAKDQERIIEVLLS